MFKSNVSLRTYFLRTMLSVLLVIGVLSGAIQIYSMNQHVTGQINDQANLVSQGIRMSIGSSKLASDSLEHQFDLRMALYAKQIALLLKGQQVNGISKGELQNISDDLGLAGVTIFAQQGNDIIGVQSTDPAEVGFSFKKVGFLPLGEALLRGDKVAMPGATYSEPNLVVLPIAQSASHQDKPSFFKYAYYHVPGSSYIIDPYIQANEIYQFTKSVGPDEWIAKMKQSNPDIEEMAVLDPQVFADPSLETKIYPPRKQVVYGSYAYKDSQDVNLLKAMVTDPHEVTYAKREDGRKVYKMFIPIDNGQVLYVALNYDKLSQPIYRLSIILILFGLVGLIALFMTTARFFNRIYENIQKIKSQIKLLETKDFTVRSDVKNGGELSELSESTNRMVETLQAVLTDTGEQAKKTQRLSVLLESDASKTMGKVYTMSMKETTDGRAAADEFIYFLDQMESALPEEFKEKNGPLLANMEQIRTLVRERTEATTDMTLTLSDLLKSLHDESSQLSEIANSLRQNLSDFKL
ncbi:methyl-accepting chemotaxis protein [Alicyclobacillus dauci]|uniref:histidine kinase n=1 Tax=Alicyclobacillus dauci TaxID=1475485 RepID=A0ABY6Z455_9BACL|nr:methyl-accepting chemotaxis protein [Alicyclobacillus dauci]WAH36785.1 methyl-accepting chemotaxis protein [Alicyclobacillus dauci]